MIELTRNQIKWIVIFQIILTVTIVLNNWRKSMKIKDRHKVTTAKYMEFYRGHLFQKYYDFTFIAEGEKRDISLGIFFNFYKKIGDNYIIIYEKDNPDNFRLTTLKVNYELGDNLDSIYTYEQLDSLDAFMPLIY